MLTSWLGREQWSRGQRPAALKSVPTQEVFVEVLPGDFYILPEMWTVTPLTPARQEMTSRAKQRLSSQRQGDWRDVGQAGVCKVCWEAEIAFNWILFTRVYVCVHMHAHVRARVCQSSVRVSSFFPSCGAQKLNSLLNLAAANFVFWTILPVTIDWVITRIIHQFFCRFLTLLVARRDTWYNELIRSYEWLPPHLSTFGWNVAQKMYALYQF